MSLVMKKNNPKGFLCLFLTLIPLLMGLPVFGQQQDSIPVADTAKKTDVVTQLQKIGAEEAKRSTSKFEADKISSVQNSLIDAIKKKILKARDYIHTGTDTSGIGAELQETDVWHTVAGDGVFTNKGQAQTYRNLTTTYKIIVELLNRLNTRKDQLDRYQRDLDKFMYEIDSLSSNPLLYRFSTDSAKSVEYAIKLMEIGKELAPADSMLKHTIQVVHQVQKLVNAEVSKLSLSLQEIEKDQQRLSSRTFAREFSNLGDDAGYTRPFKEITHISRIKGELILWFYLRNNPGKIALLLALLVAASLFLRSLKKILAEGKLLKPDFSGQLALRYPVLSATTIVLCLFQFIFPAPPFIFNCLFWMISATALTFIFKGFVSAHWMRIWYVLFILFLLACADNLILQASRVERIGMLLLAIAGIVAGCFILFRGRRHELKEKFILYFIGFMVILELASVICNIYGRYNVSKNLLSAGFFNVLIGILFLWTVRMIDEVLVLAAKVYTKQERKLFYINFERVGERAPLFLYVLLVIGWFVLFGRNFYEYKLLSDPFRKVLSQDRTIGDYTFTIDTLLIFLLILSSAIVLSKIVSYFAADKHPGRRPETGQAKAGAGSWILLIRVFIMSLGVFLAFAAAGFPVERITLVIGALGVGIGFGLQTLVNNLVSGLIIAFEKPVNVGDIVEVSGQTGVVKSIGFRSSIISSWDGADVVLPNGDLLNAHLVNWTLGGNRKRVEILVGVAYETDLDKAKLILEGLLSADEHVAEFPAPVILFHEFNTSSVDIRTVFWVRHFREAPAIKSGLIHAIHIAFQQNEIVIPFPQQDIHIHDARDDKE